MASAIEAFTPQGLTYARSVGNTQVNAVQPVGFASGGKTALIYNSGATDILILFYANAAGTPTLTFPVDGAPPTGQAGTVIEKGTTQSLNIPANADSFACIGSAAGPGIIYVQRGEGL